ncbi:TPA: ESPR-type extended signal peptide-containing protein [Stenotrophomonas maltophilia]
MNRIYRRIWNAARQCWVVASEFSSPRGKSSQITSGVAALIALPTLLCLGIGAQAKDANECSEEQEVCEEQAEQRGLMLGSISSSSPLMSPQSVGLLGAYDTVYGSGAKATGDRNAVFGRIAEANGDGVAIGYWATAKQGNATAVGAKAYANAAGSVAIGSGANTRTSSDDAIAIGRGAYAGSDGVPGALAIGAGSNARDVSIALGWKAQATSGFSVALGDEASATGQSSVALGSRSQTAESNVVSVGNSSLKRRIINVADGRVADGSSEVVTGNQLYKVKAASDAVESIARAAQSTANIARGEASSAQSTANANTLRLSGESVYVGIGAQVLSERGVALGARTSAGKQSVAVGSDAKATGQDAVALGVSSYASGSNGTALGHRSQATENSAAAMGYLSMASGSSSAAIGYGARATVSDSLSLGALANATHSGSVALGADSATSAAGQVSVGNSSKNTTRKIVNVSNGAVSATSNEAVTGAQLYQTNTIAQNAKAAADTALSQVKTSTYLLAHGIAGNDSNKAKATGAGAIATGIYTEAAGSSAVAIGNSAKALANNAMSIGGGTSATHAGSVALGFGSATSAEGQVSVGNSNTNTVRKIVNVAQGVVSGTSNEAVTGAQLFATDKTAQAADASAKIAMTNAGDALSKAAALEGLIQLAPTGVLRLGALDDGTVVSVLNRSDKQRKVTGVAAGTLSQQSSEAVTGGQLYATNVRVEEASNSVGDALSKIGDLAAQSKFAVVGDLGPGVAAHAGAVGVALGDSAEASLLSEGGVALGSFAKARGRNSVALGRASRVDESAEAGFALGVFSSVEETAGVALGSNSSVSKGAENSVAIGAGSVADESRAVSFGNAGLERRLVHIARGTADHNATTVGQLNESLATLGGGAKLDANGNVTAPAYRVQNTDQHTVGGALAILDGAVLRTTSRVDGMEGQLRSIFQDTATARADGFNQLTLAGAQGMVISNVANGLIAAGSREAVNGGQLHAVQQQLNGRIDGLEQRVEGQGPAPQSRAMALASTEQEAAAPTPPATQDDKLVADTGNAPKSSPAPQPKADALESPKPQVDTAELEKMLARANDYSDGIAREVDARLNKMDKRFNRMAAMSSAQTAMAMNTAGLATYNRLGAGVGYAEGESAMAVGYQRVLNDKGSATFSLNGAFTNSGERSVGVGVGIGW